MNFRKFVFMDQQLRVLLTVRKTCPKLKDKTLRYFIRTARWWKCGLFPATLELVWVGHKTITAEGSKLKRDYRLYQRKVDVDILNAVRNVLADVSSVSHCSDEGVTLETLLNASFTTFGISTSTFRWYSVCSTVPPTQTNTRQFLQGLAFHWKEIIPFLSPYTRLYNRGCGKWGKSRVRGT